MSQAAAEFEASHSPLSSYLSPEAPTTIFLPFNSIQLTAFYSQGVSFFSQCLPSCQHSTTSCYTCCKHQKQHLQYDVSSSVFAKLGLSLPLPAYM